MRDSRRRKIGVSIIVTVPFWAVRFYIVRGVFLWSHQSITGLMSQTQFAPKRLFFASRCLGCCS